MFSSVGGGLFFVDDWSRDGRYIASSGQISRDLMLFDLFGEPEPTLLLVSDFRYKNGRFSPDRRFLAYVSNESGDSEVYVTALDQDAERLRISTTGGGRPRWRSDGGELFYVSAEGKLMAVKVSTDSGFQAGSPEELFQLDYFRVGTSFGVSRNDYAVSSDGERFLVTTPVAGADSPLFTVVLNWAEELKRRAPAN
jgi:serine/threonine-protein kinase